MCQCHAVLTTMCPCPCLHVLLLHDHESVMYTISMRRRTSFWPTHAPIAMSMSKSMCSLNEHKRDVYLTVTRCLSTACLTPLTPPAF